MAGNKVLGFAMALFTQSRVRETQVVADGRTFTISVPSYALGEYVIVDTDKHFENGFLVWFK